jgi:hypothetical protein
MEVSKPNPIEDKPWWSKFLIPTALVALLILFGFLTFRVYIKPPGVSALPGKVLISQNDLEEKTGLRVTLLAVTAAGGMVDFRFRVTDAEKATKIFQTDKLLPYLAVAGNKVHLDPTPETLQNAKLEDGLVYYILYSNTDNLVKPGTPVSVVIGDWQLEPIIAK